MGQGVSLWTVRDIGRDERGQSTVELVVVLPVAILIAVIVVNALTFFGLCASFDQVVRQSVCTYGAAPDAGRGTAGVCAQVKQAAEEALGKEVSVEVAVRAEGSFPGLTRYRARLSYRPSLFGLSLRNSLFGIALPPLVHEVDMVVDGYRPGILF